MNKYKSYTLWVKYRARGWTPIITTKQTGANWVSPYTHLVDYAKRVFLGVSYFQRGKTWQVKPEGVKPAELIRLERANGSS